MNRKLMSLVALLIVVLLSLGACNAGTPAPAATATADTSAPAMTATPMAAEATATTEMSGSGTLGTPDNPIIMSFVPSGDSAEILASGEQIAALVSAETGLTIEANVATSFAAVVEAMCAGNAQIGWLNTFSYILAHEKDCADVSLATVRRGRAYYTGQIIANTESGIESLADVSGKKMCYVDPLSTSGYIIPRIMLAAAGVDVDTLDSTESGSHPNVVTAVYNGDCDAGATFVDARTAIAEEFPDVNEKVIVVAESPQIPNDTVSYATSLPADMASMLTAAMEKMASTDEGKAALEAVYEIEGFEVVQDSFFDEFRTQLDASGISIEELAK